MKTLFTTTGLMLLALVLVSGAGAQETLTFSNLPLIGEPSPVPNGYGRLDWSNFSYVDPYGWSESGPGYRLGPQGTDVVFVGGKVCRLYGYACFGTISNRNGFLLMNVEAAGGFGPTTIIATAYNNGRLLGAQNYFLTTERRTLTFPSSWGVATQVILQVSGAAGDLVLYNLTAYTLGGSN
jgi:hypothetical protein